jgi:hypothetical protein
MLQDLYLEMKNKYGDQKNNKEKFQEELVNRLVDLISKNSFLNPNHQ